jgi:capsular exopolysaccharide synthesis family protein
LEIGDYLRIFQRFWWVVLLAIVVGAGAGYASSLLHTPSYQSTAQLFVTTESGTSVGDAYQNNLFSQDRVVSYAGLATSEQVAARAIDQLKAPISADELRSKITATPMPKTVLLDVTATDSDPALAQTYANAVADQLVQLVSELETSRRGGTPAAGVIVVDDASYPTSPAGPKLLTRIGLGAAAGLAAGLALAVLFGVLDTRLRRRERVEAVAGSLVIGALVDEPHRSEDNLELDSGGIAVERLRELRTNLQFATKAGGGKPHVIAVTSPSRGDGRSATAMDLAAAFAESGRSVVLVDGDLLNPSLAGRLALRDDERAQASRKGLSTVLAGEHEVAESLIPEVADTSVALLPAGPVSAAHRQLWADDAAARNVLETLRRNFDYVIIDTPPLNTCTDGALAAALGDGAIVLARLRHTKSSALRRALEALESAHASFLGAVVTREPGHHIEITKYRKASSAASPTPAAAPPSGRPVAAGSATDVTQTLPTQSGGAGANDPLGEQPRGVHRFTRSDSAGR